MDRQHSKTKTSTNTNTTEATGATKANAAHASAQSAAADGEIQDDAVAALTGRINRMDSNIGDC